MVKVIFMDIDGVLNSTRSAVGLGNYPHNITADQRKYFDPVAVGLIRELCKETGSVIVLSSTWRMLNSYEDIGRALQLPIIDATPVCNDARRGKEIADWLRKNEVAKYAIVDDDSDMLPEQSPYFVQTSHEDGLRWKDYQRLVEILNP